MSTNNIEKRLTALEREIAQLKARTVAQMHPVHSLDRIHGMFEDDVAFREASKLGRKWRKSDRPLTPRKRKARKK